MPSKFSLVPVPGNKQKYRAIAQTGKRVSFEQFLGSLKAHSSLSPPDVENFVILAMNWIVSNALRARFVMWLRWAVEDRIARDLRRSSTKCRWRARRCSPAWATALVGSIATGYAGAHRNYCAVVQKLQTGARQGAARRLRLQGAGLKNRPRGACRLPEELNERSWRIPYLALRCF